MSRLTTLLSQPQRRRRLGLALCAAPVAIQALAVALLGVNTILWDEFFYVPFIREVFEGRNWWHWMTLQHNEHRVVPMKLLMVPLALLTNWDTRAEMWASVALAALTVFGLWRLYRHLGGDDLLLFAPVAWLVCSLGHYENMLYGMMVSWYFVVVGVVWMLVLLSAPGALLVAGAVLCAFTAAFTNLNGLLVFPLGLGMLLVYRRWRAAAVWLAVSIGAFVLYFVRFQMPGGQPPLPHLGLAAIARIARFGIKLLGAPLAGGSVAWSIVIGVLLIAATAAVALRWRRPSRLRRDVPAAGLIAFGALSGAMIAAGRAAYQGIPPLQSRYMLDTVLVIVGLYLLLARAVEQSEPASPPRRLLVPVLALLVPGLLAANAEGLRAALEWRNWQLQQKAILQTFDQRPASELGGIYFLEQVPPAASWLRQHRVGPFADAPEVVLLVHWQDGVPAEEILPGRPVEQTLVCPVGRIEDVAVVFATYARQNTSHVVLSLSEKGRQLGRRELAAADLKDNGWVSLPVDVRDCRGRTLVLRVESPDARPGNAVTVWTYPHYYGGEVSQGGNPRIAGRSLGLAINGFTAQLLHD
ncbi:MAG TPA: hypothetical protein VGS57_14525 [Thermoanaerobaculia bacterium]|nr:hypothetical protein [Thermoanaerobaculia bacterium]